MLHGHSKYKFLIFPTKPSWSSIDEKKSEVPFLFMKQSNLKKKFPQALQWLLHKFFSFESPGSMERKVQSLYKNSMPHWNTLPRYYQKRITSLKENDTYFKSWFILKFHKLFSWYFDIRKKSTMWKSRNCQIAYNEHRFRLRKQSPGEKSIFTGILKNYN